MVNDLMMTLDPSPLFANADNKDVFCDCGHHNLAMIKGNSRCVCMQLICVILNAMIDFQK